MSEPIRAALIRLGNAVLAGGPPDDIGPPPEVEEEYYAASDEVKRLAVEMARSQPGKGDAAIVTQEWLQGVGATRSDCGSNVEWFIPFTICGSQNQIRFCKDILGRDWITSWSLLPAVGNNRIYLNTSQRPDGEIGDCIYVDQVEQLMRGLGLQPLPTPPTQEPENAD